MVFVLIIMSVFWGIIAMMIKTERYCNRNYNRGDDPLYLELDIPHYEVKKVEQVYCKNNSARCAKYTLQNWHIKCENNVEMQELILYDVIGKYNIGDVLKLEK